MLCLRHKSAFPEGTCVVNIVEAITRSGTIIRRILGTNEAGGDKASRGRVRTLDCR
jgi:hypothetical protein